MMDKDYIDISPDLVTILSSDQAWYYHVVPVSKTINSIEFYVDESKKKEGTQSELELILNTGVSLLETKSDVIIQTLKRFYRKSDFGETQVKVSINQADDFVNQLLDEAKSLGSSDIHIEIYDERARIRIRIDGLLVERYKLEKTDYPALVNKIKIKANLDIAEKRLPQDGRIFFERNNRKFDVRVSVLPTLHGEKIVLRLLSNDATNIQIEKLGFSNEELSTYLEGIKRPNGIMLISGPTGSGKTTTLYATLKILNEEKRNILTIEDPIEYTLEGINQVQLKESIGLTFASALRTFLRQDPDVIMLGEIRDSETAQMAIRAALTGHLVLSTIHTNSAWGTVSRLIDMGVQPFLLANTLNASVAQRLLRKLCPTCCQQEEFKAGMFPPRYAPPKKLDFINRAIGCPECHYTGYKGRKALYEVIFVDMELAECIKSSQLEVKEILKRKKIKTLSENAFELLEAGITSVEEVYPLLLNS